MSEPTPDNYEFDAAEKAEKYYLLMHLVKNL